MAGKWEKREREGEGEKMREQRKKKSVWRERGPYSLSLFHFSWDWWRIMKYREFEYVLNTCQTPRS